ncbi:Isoaspartyl peptidase/L-asparaginase [Hibiscus syriacus]|uniref:Isoaspartyl peptidase/L-asparaginase n=1 Tax=Hibiscus syriacus TaxID=106335 RepID=A0A6A3CFE6_HIBSY|nr:Isoaspartyl peptidase/L-asparaginase [Hibiscus syriacus]
MEANIIDGPKRRCDVVFGLSTVKNPVSLTHLVMDKSPHFYLAFSSAEEFTKKQGVELVDNEYFITKKNVGMLKLAKEVNSILFDYRIPTTGTWRQSVAVDKEGSYAAATSTSGLMNKMTGMIDDSPLIGSGIYACELCGVSCTEEGEAVIRSTLVREVAAMMEYKGLSLNEVVDFVIKNRLGEGRSTRANE